MKTKMKRTMIIQRSEVRKLGTKSSKMKHVVPKVQRDSSGLHPLHVFSLLDKLNTCKVHR